MRPIRDAGAGRGQTRRQKYDSAEENKLLSIAQQAQKADALLNHIPPGQKKVAVEGKNRPPLPPRAPLETPVADLKRRASSNLTREAKQLLYDTPLRLHVRPALDDAGTLLGTYDNGQFAEFPLETVNDPQVARHELLHQWYDDKLDPYKRMAWESGYENRMPPRQRQMLFDVARDPNRPGYFNPHEGYAWGGELGPEYLDPQTRSIYYSDFYREPSRFNNPYEREEQQLLAALRTPETEDTRDRAADRASWPEDYQGSVGPYDVDPTPQIPEAYYVPGSPPNPFLRLPLQQYRNPWERALEELRQWRNARG